VTVLYTSNASTDHTSLGTKTIEWDLEVLILSHDNQTRQKQESWLTESESKGGPWMGE
jgi:hypothetical protein